MLILLTIISFMHGKNLAIQLKVIALFLSGQKAMTEFIDIGGTLTLLDILNQDVSKTTDRREALVVLNLIASSGRRYKELICSDAGK
jgi:hypothetical protein